MTQIMVPSSAVIRYYAFQCFKDRKEHTIKEIYGRVADHFKLSPEQLAEKTSRGTKRVYNRTQYGITNLYACGLVAKIEEAARGTYRITEKGSEFLKGDKSEAEINSYINTHKTSGDGKVALPEPETHLSEPSIAIQEPPLAAIRRNYDLLEEQLYDDLLNTILSRSPRFFEFLVKDLLVKMGYGNEEDTIVTKFIADDGVDVVINLDKLGLKKIVVQAKRYDKNNLVSIPTIKEFGGTMLGTPGVKEGIFITTSSFTAPAKEYKPGDYVLRRVDGRELCKYMINNNLGVKIKEKFIIKTVDSEYFKEK